VSFAERVGKLVMPFEEPCASDRRRRCIDQTVRKFGVSERLARRDSTRRCAAAASATPTQLEGHLNRGPQAHHALGLNPAT